MEWRPDATRFLTRDEIRSVLESLDRRLRRGTELDWLRASAFRFAACAGLRSFEIVELNTDSLHLAGDRPYIHVARGKGGRPRRVPLWWDAGMLNFCRALAAWRGGRDARACLLAPRNPDRQRYDRREIARLFRAACSVLGRERQSSLHIHMGRHSFASHALRAGRSLAEVRDALGHANVSITSLYLHAAEEGSAVGTIY